MRPGAKTDLCEGRRGRPPTELAGEVDARILDTAAQVFLEQGFAGASIGEIAERARAGKPTIYARYPSKEALFEAAFLRRIAERNARLETLHFEGGTVEDRLVRVGVGLVEETLTEEAIALLRLAVSEARRLPDVVGGLMRQSRERGCVQVARLLADSIADAFEPNTSEASALKAGRIFIESVLLPFLLRALAEGDLGTLRGEIEAHVRERVPFFLTGLRHGGLEG